MKCPECQFDNPEDAKFCNGCGIRFEDVCPECGRANPPRSNFCNKCGHNLTLPSEPFPKELSFDEKIDKIQRYLPKGLTEKILSQRDKIEGERKQVTVMFCDMEGFSELSERVGPEEAYGIMDQVYEILIHKVHDYEGTVNEMTGDGIMALFGAPIALEDAPQRAIRSAYAIHRGMTIFSERLKQDRGIPPIKMRIGIHTGPVVVGTLGNDLRVEFKAVGDTVNLASRMEGLAEPGSTLVTEDTFKLTEGLFRFEALGARQVKGREEPIRVYRVIAPSTRRTRFDVSAERGLTPLVGRERELELLQDGFARAKGGRGQAVSIMAEAGVGKSRLLYEFRKAVANEDVTFLEGKCLSYSRGVIYHPVIDILKSNFDIQENDGDLEIKEKVQRGLRALGADEASTLPYLMELLWVKDSIIDQIPMSPEARKDRIMEAVKRITLKGAEIRPLILAVEDLHWIDRSSEEYLKGLLDNISGASVFLIFTYRPEFVHTWGGKSYHSQITINRLSNRESLAIVSHILGSEDIDQDLEELVLEKTEGVPFFIEEFVKSLKDLKLIERTNGRYYLTKEIQDVAIPSTVQDVIMARVDALPDGAKEVLQTGSVIEREFSYELMKRAADISQEDLLSHLSVLKDSELLYERGIYPQSTYIFKHALTREVIYNSILTSRKRRLHEQIGHAIEELHEENMDEHYGVLAEHFIKGDNYEKGAEYSNLAGKRAAKTGSHKDAIEYAKRRVSCLERLSKTDATQRKTIDARTALATYHVNLTQLVDAKDSVAPIVDLALELNYQRRLPGIYTAIGLYSLWVEEDYSKGLQYLSEVFKISENVDDRSSHFIPLFHASYYLGVTLSLNCEFEKSLNYLEKCEDLSGSTNDVVGISFAKGTTSFVYVLQGKIDLTTQTNEQALQIAEESGDIYTRGMAYVTYGISCYSKGALGEAEKNLLKGLLFCERSAQLGWRPLGLFFLGHLYVDMREYEKAQFYYEKGVSILESCKILPSLNSAFRIAVARAKVFNKHQDVDLSEVLRYCKRNRIKAFEGWNARYMGEILSNIDDHHMNEAGHWIKTAIEADKRNGMRWFLGKDYVLYAEWSKRQGHLSRARDHLSKAMEILRECGADGWVEKYEKGLAAIS